MLRNLRSPTVTGFTATLLQGIRSFSDTFNIVGNPGSWLLIYRVFCLSVDVSKESLWQAPAAAALCQQHRSLEGLALINKGTKAGPGGRSSVSGVQ